MIARNAWLAGAAILGLMAADAAPVLAAPTQDGVSAQTQKHHRRAPARITVSPRSRYPYSTVSTPYPKPYEYEYPGPGAVRQCVAKLIPENCPSGTVIYPHTYCWWETPR